MQHRCAHVGQRTKLTIAHVGDSCRILDNARIRSEQPRDVRPVLVQVRADRAGSETARDIGAAPLKRVDGADHVRSIETGDHSPLQREQRRSHCPACHCHIQLSILVKTYAPRRIDKCKAKILGHYFGSQIFTSAGRVIFLRICEKQLLQMLELILKREAYLQAGEDVLKTRLDPGQLVFERIAGGRLFITIQQKIRHFAVFGKALSGRRDHNKSSFRIIAHDFLDLAKLGGVRNGCAPEFGDD